ncbi:MAG: hypothetical protein IPK80_07335 [Nannocystis sp.]|nr:hypothetical protein [Nannocystis sp.]
MRNTPKSQEQAFSETTKQAAELGSWARARVLYIEGPQEVHPSLDAEVEDSLRSLAQPLAAEQAEQILERALAQAAVVPPGGVASARSDASVLSLAAARERRSHWVWLGASLTALAGAAAIILAIASGPEGSSVPSPSLTSTTPQDLHFQLDVHGGHAVVRGHDASSGSEFFLTDGDHLTLTMTPVERVRTDLEIHIYATQDGRQRDLPWVVRIGDPALGDREIQGNLDDLGLGTWRLSIEAVDSRSRSVRWRGEAMLRIEPRAAE